MAALVNAVPVTSIRMDPGTLVAGRFRIEAVAGRGAFATVYRAYDRETDSTVALKLLRDVETFNRTRFEREARLLSRFQHPGIVRFVGYGDSEDGYFLALEWLDGESPRGPDRHSRGALDRSRATLISV